MPQTSTKKQRALKQDGRLVPLTTNDIAQKVKPGRIQWSKSLRKRRNSYTRICRGPLPVSAGRNDMADIPNCATLVQTGKSSNSPDVTASCFPGCCYCCCCCCCYAVHSNHPSNARRPELSRPQPRACHAHKSSACALGSSTPWLQTASWSRWWRSK